MRDGLPDCARYEDDVRDREHGFPSDIIGKHPGDKPANKGPERSRGRDQFLCTISFVRYCPEVRDSRRDDVPSESSIVVRGPDQIQW